MACEKNISAQEIERFLKEVDKTFPVPLSKKQNLSEYAKKLYKYATLCIEILDGKIVSMVAGYTEKIEDNIAYIAVVATTKDARGKGFAKKLLVEFMDICRVKEIDAVHLYTVARNAVAVSMYKKLGFMEYDAQNELRPNDLHLIYYFKKEETN